MAKKFKVLNIDFQHALVQFYDDEVLDENNIPMTTTLNIGLHNSEVPLTEATFANYISTYFPVNKIYAHLNHKQHDMEYLNSQINAEVSINERTFNSSALISTTDYITKLVNEIKTANDISANK